MRIERTLGITTAAATACLLLGTADAAERNRTGDAAPKHSGSTHHASATARHGGKTSNDRSMHSSSVRSKRASLGKQRSDNRQQRNRGGNNHSASNRPADDGIQPDANVQVELPSRDDDNQSGNESEDDDTSGILLGVPP